MPLVSGKLKRAQRVVIYGPEGVGKSTFASKFPGPGFIDVEDGTGELDVPRYSPIPTSTEMIYKAINELSNNPDVATIVIDTGDKADSILIQGICSKAGKAGIEDFGYGKGYTFAAEEFAKLLDHLTAVKNNGTNVVILCHSEIKKFELPEEMGAYDRWQLKLSKKASPLLKEWADMLLFANYKTFVIEDEKTKSKKAQGSQRVMYTAHNACWDAKNRHGLPEEIPFEYQYIAHCIPDMKRPQQVQQPVTQVPQQQQPIQQNEQMQYTVSNPTPAPATVVKQQSVPFYDSSEINKLNIPEQLKQLMIADGINPEQIQKAVGAIGYFPVDTPLENYGTDFILGRLVGSWDGVKRFITDKGL